MDAHLPILRRLGILLLVFFGLHLASVILDGSSSHSYSVDLGSLIFGLLLSAGRVGAVPWLAFFTSWQLVAAVAGAVLVAVLPLTRQFLSGSALVMAISSCLIEAAVSLWILRELRRPEIDDALRAAGRRPVKRVIAWGAGTAGVFAAVAVALMLTLAPLFTALNTKAIDAARRQLGDGYQFQVTSFRSDSRGWRAHVVARRGDEVKQLDVGEPQP